MDGAASIGPFLSDWRRVVNSSPHAHFWLTNSVNDATSETRAGDPTADCENPEEEEVRRLQKRNSDLFSPHEHDVPAPQKQTFAIDPL